MSPDEPDLERERRDADQQYNEALTAFDAALVRTSARVVTGLVADSSTPPLPTGWRGRGLRIVADWLAPWIERQHAFNARTAETVESLATRDHERAIAFEQFQHALISFLQRVTAFVDTKDRQLAATAAERIDGQQRTLGALRQRMDDTLPELRAQVVVLQRAMEMLKHRIAERATDA